MRKDSPYLQAETKTQIRERVKATLNDPNVKLKRNYKRRKPDPRAAERPRDMRPVSVERPMLIERMVAPPGMVEPKTFVPIRKRRVWTVDSAAKAIYEILVGK